MLWRSSLGITERPGIALRNGLLVCLMIQTHTVQSSTLQLFKMQWLICNLSIYYKPTLTMPGSLLIIFPYITPPGKCFPIIDHATYQLYTTYFFVHGSKSKQCGFGSLTFWYGAKGGVRQGEEKH